MATRDFHQMHSGGVDEFHGEMLVTLQQANEVMLRSQGLLLTCMSTF